MNSGGLKVLKAAHQGNFTLSVSGHSEQCLDSNSLDLGASSS